MTSEKIENAPYNPSASMEDLYRARAKESSNRRFLALSYYDKNPPRAELFPYLSQEQKAAQIQDIQNGLSLYYNQLRLDHMEGRQDAIASGIAKVTEYSRLLNDLETPVKNLENKQKPARDYSYVRTLNKPISTANGVRFNYLWLSCMLQSTMGKNLSPEWAKAFKDFSLYPGSASFLFYYPRGLSLLGNRAKHIVPGSWMTEEELELCKTVGFWERLFAQMNIDKYWMLNDLVWGPANMACFLWYNSFYVYHFLGLTIKVGSTAKEMAQFGNLLTVALFGMDLLSSLCQIIEAHYEHERHLDVLTRQLGELNTEPLAYRRKQKEIADYEFEYRYTQKSLLISFGYALCLVVGFAVMVGICGNPFGATYAFIAGAAMCWGGNVIKDGLNNSLNLEKASEELWLIQKQDEALCAGWNAQDANCYGNQIILREHMRLSKNFSKKQAQLSVLENKLYFTLALDITVPAVLWIAMLACPWTQGAILVAATLLVAYVAYQCLIRYSERCTERCELVTDLSKAQDDPNFVGYVRTGENLYYFDKPQGIPETDLSQHIKSFDESTQFSFKETTKQFFYAFITLAPIFSNVDKLADELSKFSSTRRLTDSQVKAIQDNIATPDAPAPKLIAPTALTAAAAPSKSNWVSAKFFGKKTWENVANGDETKNPVLCELVVPRLND